LGVGVGVGVARSATEERTTKTTHGDGGEREALPPERMRETSLATLGFSATLRTSILTSGGGRKGRPVQKKAPQMRGRVLLSFLPPALHSGTHARARPSPDSENRRSRAFHESPAVGFSVCRRGRGGRESEGVDRRSLF